MLLGAQLHEHQAARITVTVCGQMMLPNQYKVRDFMTSSRRLCDEQKMAYSSAQHCFHLCTQDTDT